MAKNKDPDQTAPIGAVCSGSTLFASILNSSVMLGKYRKMGNFHVVQFSRYFAVSHEPRKLKSAKNFPSLINCLFAIIQKYNCVSICVHKTPVSLTDQHN